MQPRTAFATPSEYFAAPRLPRGVRFALWPTFETHRKPHAFPTLARLARHIHRARAGFGLQLSEEPVSFTDGRRTLVRIDASDACGERHRLIGYAWLGSPSPRDALAAAIRDAEPDAPAQEAAA